MKIAFFYREISTLNWCIKMLFQLFFQKLSKHP